ncbi:phosphatase PAP2 family protein [Alloscardovia venturai]|uniref:Phosphatase PAP2 family protein n=1 Tax=Alloscardovia venturai TaxID=1769421 RepID=A0ABW2Y733_9BIFI
MVEKTESSTDVETDSMDANSMNASNEESGESRHVDRGSDAYLADHPRVSSVVWAWITGICALIGSAVAFYLGVMRLTGQRFDSWMWSEFSTAFPFLNTAFVTPFRNSRIIIGICIGMIALALIIAIARKRFYTFTLIVIFVLVSFAISFTLKRVLPRPVLDSLIPDPANSAPSGHTAFTVIAGVALIMSVPRILRALVTLWSTFFTSMVATMVIFDRWHRPTDVVTAILLVGGLGLITMSFTRASGMDLQGKRRSSSSIQIVSTLFVTLGGAAILYSAYVVSQIVDVIAYQPDAFTTSAAWATLALIFGTSAVVYGTVLAVRQSTASPLTRIGLIGQPPAPPKK